MNMQINFSNRITQAFFSILMALFFFQAAMANIVADGSDPAKAPQIRELRDGVVVIDIAPPDKDGNSYNRFIRFNNDGEIKVIVINNSYKGKAIIEDVGQVDANSKLTETEPVKAIVFNVTGENNSNLYKIKIISIEESSKFILANTNGASFNDCVFTNFCEVVFLGANNKSDVKVFKTQTSKDSTTGLNGNETDVNKLGVTSNPHLVNEDNVPSYFDKEHGILGCKHYRRGCKLKAACCGKLYVCRFCHDEHENHRIDRKATKEMQCMHCFTVQSAAQYCAKCKERMSIYYCDICKLWDDNPNKEIYHCPHCGLCRVGLGLGKDTYHCMGCNACMAIDRRDTHACVPNALHSNCPVCEEDLFNSAKPSLFMRCGHAIHEGCLTEYLKTNYVCPVCRRSVVDTQEYFKHIDDLMQNQQGMMPEEYQNILSYILCNDCQSRSRVPWHFTHHKCAACGSYNTQVERRVRFELAINTPENMQIMRTPVVIQH
jgi:hypothetical protein